MLETFLKSIDRNLQVFQSKIILFVINRLFESISLVRELPVKIICRNSPIKINLVIDVLCLFGIFTKRVDNIFVSKDIIDKCVDLLRRVVF